jgi:hypothetical protein
MIGIYQAKASVKLPKIGVAENPISRKHQLSLVFFLEIPFIFTFCNTGGLIRFDR